MHSTCPVRHQSPHENNSSVVNSPHSQRCFRRLTPFFGSAFLSVHFDVFDVFTSFHGIRTAPAEPRLADQEQHRLAAARGLVERPFPTFASDAPSATSQSRNAMAGPLSGWNDSRKYATRQFP